MTDPSNEPGPPPSSMPPPPPSSMPPPPPSSMPQPPAAGWGGPQVGQLPERIGGPFYEPGLAILLTIVTCGIWATVWSWRTGEDLKLYTGNGLGGVASALLCFFVSPVVMFTIPNEIEQMYRAEGRESPVSTMIGLWFLLPIVGNFIWYFKTQAALNDFWTSKGVPRG